MKQNAFYFEICNLSNYVQTQNEHKATLIYEFRFNSCKVTSKQETT